MPTRPRRLCLHPGCRQTTSTRYCEAHARQARPAFEQDGRLSASERGYDHRWHVVRDGYINEHPLCEICAEHGRVQVAEHVHHKQSIRERPDLRLVSANLMSLCERCHNGLEAHRRNAMR